MIRHAVPSDKPALIGLAAHFHAAAPQLAALPFSPLAAVRTAHAAMQGGLVLVLDLDGIKGALVALLQPLPFSDAVAAREVAFWIEPEHRGRWGRRMIEQYEAWAASKGVALVGLACLDERTESAFGRLGYASCETMMTKAI